jgi:hypothetical protein
LGGVNQGLARPVYQVGMLGSVARLPRAAAIRTGMPAVRRREKGDIDGLVRRAAGAEVTLQGH